MKWISVKEQLPPENKEIIVCGNHSCKVWSTEIYISRSYEQKPIEPQVLDWTTYRDIEIYYWMPLPEPPNEMD